jgi:phage regulator Rha-like protein
MELQVLQSKIHEIRGLKVMLDFDLASMYEVETRVLNQIVKRNLIRFPDDFRFQLDKSEFDNLISQSVISSWGGSRKLPFVFTEQGVAMLSGLLNSDKAININIAIMRAFVEIRKVLTEQSFLSIEIMKMKQELEERLGEHDVQLLEIYSVMEDLLVDKVKHKKWEDRNRIGFE